METGGYLSLFTTAYGWYYSGVLWQILAGTGLIFIPILGLVVDHITEVRSQGSLVSIDSDRALAGLEVKFILLLLVLLVAAVPTSLTAFNPNTLRFTEPEGVFSGPARTLTQAEAANYAYGRTFDDHAFTTSAVNIPAWWFAVMKISGGVSHALTTSVADSGEGFRAVKQMADTASISNPELRNEVNVMYTDCYARALSLYQSDTGASTVLPPQHADIAGIDVNWIGSKYLFDNYYDQIHARVIRGFPYQNNVSTQYDTDPGAGQPKCSDLWTHIQETIYTEARDDGTVGALRNAWDQGIRVFSNPTSENFRREVAQMYLHNTPKDITLTADQLQALRTQGDGFLSQAASVVGDGFGSIALTKTAAVLELAITAIIDALVTVQAYLLMLLYIFIPLGMLVSRYSIGYLMSMGLLLFSIHMWPAIWAIAAWLDNNIATALFGDQSAINTLITSGPRELNKRIIHSISVLVIYVSGPIVLTWVISAAGNRTVALAAAGAGSAVAGAGGAGGVQQSQGRQLGAAGNWASESAGKVGALHKPAK